MIFALAWPPLARLLRNGRAAISTIAWAAVALALALVAHGGGWYRGVDPIVLGPFGGLVLPLLAYTITGGVLGPRAFATSIEPLVALGAPPARTSLAAIAVGAAACAAIGALLGSAVAALAHGAGDAPRWADAASTAYASAIGGAAYAAWFAAGATLTRSGMGRPALLVVDWVLGAGDGFAALFTPRAHVRNLLGGPPPGELPQGASAAALAVIAIACAAFAARRARRMAFGF
jgi:hypothetical protein